MLQPSFLQLGFSTVPPRTWNNLVFKLIYQFHGSLKVKLSVQCRSPNYPWKKPCVIFITLKVHNSSYISLKFNSYGGVPCLTWGWMDPTVSSFGMWKTNVWIWTVAHQCVRSDLCLKQQCFCYQGWVTKNFCVFSWTRSFIRKKGE